MKEAKDKDVVDIAVDKDIIVGIDIGIVHLGMVWMKKSTQQFVGCKLIDLTRVIDEHHRFHKMRSPKECKFKHDNGCLLDKINHFCDLYTWLLEKASCIYIERQPIQGIIIVQEFLFDKFRDKVILISPRSMHAYFFGQKTDYEMRKQLSLEVAAKFPMSLECREEFERLRDRPIYTERGHDISDAMLVAQYGWTRELKDRPRKRQTASQDVTPFTPLRFDEIPEDDEDERLREVRKFEHVCNHLTQFLYVKTVK